MQTFQVYNPSSVWKTIMIACFNSGCFPHRRRVIHPLKRLCYKRILTLLDNYRELEISTPSFTLKCRASLMTFLSIYCYLYNNQINARALIDQSAVGYCASKPTEKSRVFYELIG